MKRIISIFLALLLMSSVLVACADSSDGGKDSTAAPKDDVSTEAPVGPDLPDTNYGGKEFRVLTKGTSQAHWKSMDISADELTVDAISNAVYIRNLAVSEKYGIEVVEHHVANYFAQQDEATLSCNAGTDDYDMFCLKPEAVISSLVNKAQLMDLNNMTYMDLEAPWYDQNSISQLSLGGKVYLCTGAMLIMDDDATGAVFFNKKIAENNGIPSFYKMVDDGEWTIDVMYTYAQQVANDENADGNMTAREDTWGCLSERSVTLALIAGADLRIVSKDGDDMPYISAGEESYIAMMDKVLALQNDSEVTMFAESLSGYSDVWVEALDVAFNEDRALFYAAWLNRATLFRNMETDFGILPYPKYDKDQDDYCSFVSLYCANSISVPITITDVDFVSTAIEALSAESMLNETSLNDAYYKKTLEFRGVRDEESQRMLDIIFKNTLFDLGYMYNWSNVCSTVMDQSGVAGGSSGSYVTALTSLSKSINKSIEKTMDKVFE